MSGQETKSPIGSSADALEFKTSLEGKNFETNEVVNCPVLGAAISLDICLRGSDGLPCNYNLQVQFLSRGENKPSKKVLLCGAPRRIPVQEILRGKRDGA